MKAVTLELIGPLNMYVGIGIEIIVSVFLGFMVGVERERKVKSAGLKTNVLICLGSTLYTTVSLLNQTATSDPNRAMAQIVSGVGFLGAGAIIHGKATVSGLTTAATIWLVAAVGMTVGAGYPIVACLFTLTVLFVLRIMDPMYEKFFEGRHFFLIELEGFRPFEEIIRWKFSADPGAIIDLHQEKRQDGDRAFYSVWGKFHTNPKTFKILVKFLESDKKIKTIQYRQVESE